ncbi:MAG: hypothetical protein ACRC11_03000, partial [Xenococcaceae cyanobacterium]
AVNLANHINDKIKQIDVFRKIAKVYIEANHQDLVARLLPSKIVAEEKDLQNKIMKRNQPDPRVIKAYLLVKRDKYNEASEFLESFTNEIEPDLKTELLVYMFGTRYHKYIKLDRDRKAQTIIDRAIQLSLTIHHKIIDAGLFNEENLADFSCQIFVLLDIVFLYFKHSDIGQKVQIIEQIQAMSQKIKKQIQERKSTDEKIQKSYKQDLKHEYDGLIRYICNKYIELKKYREALSILKEEYSDVEKIKNLVEIAIKYTVSPSVIDEETENILKEIRLAHQ